MVNTTFPELRETIAPRTTTAGCRNDGAYERRCVFRVQDFKIQSSQRFLRRVLSPDSPNRGLLMVHGAGQGKTCSGDSNSRGIYQYAPSFKINEFLFSANPEYSRELSWSIV
jgi:hypothetical protein